jgi:hypothetical protein
MSAQEAPITRDEILGILAAIALDRQNALKGRSVVGDFGAGERLIP